MKLLFVSCMAALCVAAVGCGGGSGGQASVRGEATLTGLSDHSAILISLVGPVSRAANAGTDGTYAFEGLPAGTYAVTVSAPSTFEGAVTVPVTAPAEGAANAPAVHLSPYGAISGTVSGASPGTTVVVAGTGASAATDATGGYQLSGVPVGTHMLVASDGDRRGSTTGVSVLYAQTSTAPAFELALPSGSGSLSGTVALGAESDRSGVVITLSGPAQGAAVTGADGTYSFSSLPPGEYLLLLSAPSTAEGTQTQRVTVAGSTSVATVTFAPLGTLTGTAQLGSASTGNAGILVFVPGYATFTDGAGAWTLRGVPVGSYEVQAFHDGYSTGLASGQVVRYAQSTAVGNLALTSNGSADTVVTIAANVRLPAVNDHSGITVTVDGNLTASTDAAGAFSLPGVTSGIHSFAIDRGGIYHRDLDAVLVLPTSELLIVDTTTVPAQLLPFNGLVLSLGVQVASVPNPVWPMTSPDGRYVLYLGNFDGPVGPLLLTDTSTGATRRLAENALPFGYRFSEDSAHFLFAHEPNGNAATLTLGASAGGPLTELSNVASPDAVQEVAGGRLLFVEFPVEFMPGQDIGLLTSVAWDGSERMPLGDTVFIRAPNSFWLDSTRTRVGLWDYFTGGNVSAVGVDGTNPTPLVPAAWSVELLGGDTLGIWSEGGPWVSGDFSTANLASGGFGTVATDVMFPQMSFGIPDHPGQLMVLTSSAPGGTYQAFAIDLMASTALPIAPNVADGSRLVFHGDWVAAFFDDDSSTDTSSLQLVNIVNSLLRPIGSGLQRQVSFSGDGTKVAYNDADKIYVAATATSEVPVEMPFPAPVQYSLSQNGAYLLVKATNGIGDELNLVYVGGTTNQLVPGAPEVNGEFRGAHAFYYFYDSSGVRHDRAIRLGAMTPIDLSSDQVSTMSWAGSTLVYIDGASTESQVGTLKLFSTTDDSITTLASGVDGVTMRELDATHLMVLTGNDGSDPFLGALHVVDLTARTIHQVAEVGSALKAVVIGNQLALITGVLNAGTLELTSFTGTPRTTLAERAASCVAAPSQTALTCVTLTPEPTVEWIPIDGSPRRKMADGVHELMTLSLPPDSEVIDIPHQAPGVAPALTVGNVETGEALGLTAGDALLMRLPSGLMYLKPSAPDGYPFEAGAYLAPNP